MNTNLPPILDFNESSNKGTLFDTRDGQSYPVIKIGNQIWLAENFRYLPKENEEFHNSWVYDNDNSYIEKGYGRLYDWNTAMSITPEGWKLPSNEDFLELKDFIIKDNNLDGNKVGCYLKSTTDFIVFPGLPLNNDKYGFNAKPTGYYDVSTGRFNGIFYLVDIWSSTEKKNTLGTHWLLSWYNISFRYSDFYSDNINKGFSVRLIKKLPYV